MTQFPTSTEQGITIVVGDTVHQVHVLPQGGKVEVLPARFYFYFSGGQLGTAEGAYLGKLLHGPYQKHTRQKQLLEQGIFDKGLRIGTWKQWYPAGHLASQKEYKKGYLHGSWFSYSPTGALLWSRAYKNGLPHGRWASYLPNSRIQSEESWKEGVRQGGFKEYYPSGALKRQGSYHSGQLHGTLREYSETGTVLKERYRHGEPKVKDEIPAQRWKEKHIRKGPWFHKKKKDDVPPQETQPMLQEPEQELQEKKRLRWWSFKTRKKQETVE